MTTHPNNTTSHESTVRYTLRKSGMLRTLLIGLGPPLLGAWLLAMLPGSEGRELFISVMAFLFFLGVDLLILYVLTLRRRLNEAWERESARLCASMRIFNDIENLKPLVLPGKVELRPIDFIRNNGRSLRRYPITSEAMKNLTKGYTAKNPHYDSPSQRDRSTYAIANSLLVQLHSVGLLSVTGSDHNKLATLTSEGREALDHLLSTEGNSPPHPTHK